MKKRLFFALILALSFTIISCKETTTHTEEYGVIEITGKVTDTQGIALAGIKITGKESSTSEKPLSISATTDSRGGYTLKGETKNLDGFSLVLETSDASNKFLGQTQVISIREEDFTGSYKNDRYYQGTARKTADFTLLVNDLNK